MRIQIRQWAPGTAAGALLLTLGMALMASLGDAQGEMGPQPPFGLPPLPWPADNAYSQGKAELGWLLFFDKRLSSDGSVACASCHSPARAFTDGAPVATGIRNQSGNRSAPTVINQAYNTEQFWDGRAPSLEEQAKGPIANPMEMTTEKDAAAAHQACVARLRALPGYRQRFKQLFGTEEFTIDHVARAIATFERTVLSGNSSFDRYKAGDQRAMTPEQVRGMSLYFGKAACAGCHRGPNFTDGSYANTGIGMDQGNPDLGRYMVTDREADKGAFKTPTLREIEHTAPYMHDGSLKTLEAVVEYYNKGGIPNPYLDSRIEPLKLSEQEQQDLVVFLKALSGEGWQHVTAPTQFP